MKYLLITALAVVSLNSYAGLFSDSKEEKMLDKQEDEVKANAKQREEAIDRQEERYEEQAKVNKDKIKLEEEQRLNQIKDQKKKVD